MKPSLLVLGAASILVAPGATAQVKPPGTSPSVTTSTQASPGGPAAAFPPPPSAPRVITPIAQSSHGPATYGQPAAPAVQTGPAPGSADGIAPLPPLAPPPPSQLGDNLAAPFSPAEIVKMRKQFDSTRRAKAYRPVRTVPRISSLTVDLSPGSSLPIVRMLPGETSTLLFLDAGGNAWPLATAPRVSDGRLFDVEWLQGTATVVISALSPYEDGNLSVLLQGFATPVVVKLATGEPDSKATSRIVDYRLDLRIPGRAPGAPKGQTGTDKIALYDDIMQGFLDGVPPPAAKPIKVSGPSSGKARIWSHDGALFVRTPLSIQTAFDQSMAAGDGTKVYRLPLTPFVTLADGEHAVTLQLDID